MKVYEVIIEYTITQLDRPFSYVYHGNKEISLYSRVYINFHNRKIVGFIINISDYEGNEEDYKKQYGISLSEIDDVIDEKPLINDDLAALAKKVADYYYAPLVSVYFAMLPPSLKPTLSYLNHAKIAYDNYLIATENVSSIKLTSKQSEVYHKVLSEGKVNKNQYSSSVVNSLINKGLLQIVKEEKRRLKLDTIDKISDLKLNDEQEKAFDSIVNDKDKTYLLEGVTGSGKTEVYIQVAKKLIAQNKKVILLVPEITLTYQMVNRFRQRFDRVAILHSALTSGERYDEYRKIKNGEIDIVIGARSAIFAPLDNLGLIIIDEEHSDTYKQEDQLPYYSALKVALFRQEQTGCKIVLGSATPCLETKSRALKGVYKQLLLTKRATSVLLPETKIVDMRLKENISKESIILSKPLKEAISDRLNKHEQTILLINRRGYSPYVSCLDCGYLLKCPDCQVALTYHKENDSLICHHCGFNTPMVSACPKCKSKRIFTFGFGSEKVESEVNKIFPHARTLRLDSDVTKLKNRTRDTLMAMEHGDADILIGTSIVSKGHDFNNVTLVGVVLADTGLSIPSFRASENTFSLLTQAIGRSGRTKPGLALIQTYNPSNYVIKSASKQDYLSFYVNEINLRKALQNPPYTYQTLLTISSKDEEEVINNASETYNYLINTLPKTVSVIGPSDLFIKKYLNHYRKKILLKYKNFSDIENALDNLRTAFNHNKTSSLIINVDPYNDY